MKKITILLDSPEERIEEVTWKVEVFLRTLELEFTVQRTTSDLIGEERPRQNL